MKRIILLIAASLLMNFYTLAQVSEPTNVTFTQIQWTTARVEWDGYVNNLGWCPYPTYEIVYGEAGFDFIGGGGIHVLKETYPTGFGVGTYHFTRTLSNLSVATTYDVYLRTTCDAGHNDGLVYDYNTIWVGPFAFTTLDYPCQTPTNLSTLNLSANSVDILWDSTNAAYYEIQWKEFPSGAYSNGYTASNQYSISSLNDGTMYQVEARSICATDSSSYSSVLYFNTVVSDISEFINTTNAEIIYAYDIAGRRIEDFNNFSGICIVGLKVNSQEIVVKTYKTK